MVAFFIHVLAEDAAVPASQIFRLPDSVDSRIAPLIQVATTCLHAQRLGQVSLGESVAVLLAPDHVSVIDAGCWSFNEVGMVQIRSSDGRIYLTPREKFE